MVQPQPQLPARPSQDKAAVLTLLFPSQKDPNPSPNTLWALRAWGFVALFGFGVLFFHGWDFPTAWHIGNAPLGEGIEQIPRGIALHWPQSCWEELRGPPSPQLCSTFPPPRNKTPKFLLFSQSPWATPGFAVTEGKTPIPR